MIVPFCPTVPLSHTVGQWDKVGQMGQWDRWDS